MQPRPLPTSIRHRPFHVAEARHLGVSDERLRRRDLVLPTRGIRWRSDEPPEGIDRIRAVAPLMLPGWFVSHTSAAELWDLPIPRRHRGGDVHLTSPQPHAQTRRPGLVGHRTRPEYRAVRPRWGVPTSSPATTWVECGSLLGLDELVVLGDAIVGRHQLDTGIEDLHEVLDARPRCRGAVRLRAALELVRVGSGSPKETELRLVIVRAGFPEPSLQVPILDVRGNRVGRVDMAYPSRRLIIEYEGDQHRTDDLQWASDIRRYRDFERLGWSTLRVTKRDLDVHLAALLEVLAERLGYR
ncbi:hypothetical protein [Curtobacterium sp. RRHDQ10]|uniref:hypothetical protein n=1 Tax=Curtobacterium phyllosphaerae TaxID=3413379 RepID=UPI003BF34F75